MMPDASLPHYNLHVVGPNGEPSAVVPHHGHDYMDGKLGKKVMKLAMQKTKMKHPFRTRMRKTKTPHYY
jgi:hypothetical protein